MTTPLNIIVTQYGPIPKAEKALQRKARLLQGYYRHTILHLPIGKGPTESSTQEYCNMLIDGKANGGNFLTPEIFEYAKFRCRDKRSVETIDEFRLFNNMLSSMPMCFNLFVPLRAAVRRGEDFVTSVFQNVLPHLGILKIINIEIEYIPVPIEEYIDDKTAFDAFVEYRNRSGQKGCIAIETKYVDSLGKNNPKSIKRKPKIAEGIGCFTSKGLNKIETECPQIVRNFLLTEKYRLNHHFANSQSIILSLKDDGESDNEISEFRTMLKTEFQSKIQKLTLEDLAEVIRQFCPSNEKRWIEEFYKRYLSFERIEELMESMVRRDGG